MIRIMPKKLAWGLTFLALWASPGICEPIEMHSTDGQLVVKGEIVSTDGSVVTLNSPGYGRVVLELDKFSCIGSGCSRLRVEDAFGIHGSNTIGEVLTPTLIQAFAAKRQLRVEKKVGASAEEIGLDLLEAGGAAFASIDLRSHGSGTAFPGLERGLAEIGASSRPIKENEIAALRAAGYSIEPHVLALDGILILVSPENPIKELSLEQIGKIFAGEIDDWFAVGGNPGAIQIYARDDKSGTYDTFNSLVLKPYGLKLSDMAQRFESSVELSDDVARDPGGIGFIGFAYQRNAKALAISTPCGITKHPTEFNVRTEEYALARRLYYYTTDKMKSPQAKAFLEYALSDEAQIQVTDAGFVNQQIDFLPFSAQANRVALAVNAPPEDFNIGLMQQLVSLMQGMKRMSVTFRFERNSSALDVKARQDARRLARYLQKPEIKEKEIFLLGFADSTGPFDANTVISISRAVTVRDALIEAAGKAIDPAKIVVRAFSEIMPVDCNSTDTGREKNRRVEVWMRE